MSSGDASSVIPSIDGGLNAGSIFFRLAPKCHREHPVARYGLLVAKAPQAYLKSLMRSGPLPWCTPLDDDDSLPSRIREFIKKALGDRAKLTKLTFSVLNTAR